MIDRRCLWRFGCSRRNNNTHPKNATNQKVFLRASILPPLRERGKEALEENQRVRRLPRYLLPEEREHENQTTRRPRFCRGREDDRRSGTRENRTRAFPPGGSVFRSRKEESSTFEPIVLLFRCLQRYAGVGSIKSMILPQVHLRKPCYDFSFL